MKRFLAILLGIITIFTFTSCGKKVETDSSASGGESAENKEDNVEFSDIVVAENGKSDYKIVIPETPSSEMIFAKDELKQFFYEITGTVLAVVSENEFTYSKDLKCISLGENKISKDAGVTIDKNIVTPEGFKVVSKDNSVFIIGGGNNGQIYGVYDFLEKAYNLKFYAEDEIYIEKTDKAYLPLLDYVENPTLEIRSIGSYEFNNNEIFRKRMRTHLRSEGWIYTSHSFFQIMPPAIYYDEHKDWYSKDKTQLCLTNDEMTAQFINNLYDIYNKPQYKDAVNCMLGLEDSNTFCTCPKCLEETKKYKESGIMVRFCNKVYEGLRKKLDENGQKGRKVRLFMYAYMKTLSAPVDGSGNPLDKSILPGENIGLMIAPLNAKYDRPLNHEINSDVKNQIEKWGTLFKNNIYMYIYGANFGIYPLIVNDFGSMKGNISYFSDFGSVGVFWLDAYNRISPNLSQLKNYMQSKLLWNVDENPEELIKDFCDHYYRDASQYIVRYIDLIRMQYLENEIKYNKHCVVHTSAGITWLQPEYWPLEMLNACDKLFDNAFKSIEKYKDSDVILYNKLESRLKLQSLSHRLLTLELYRSVMPVSVVLNMIDDFEKDCAKVGLTETGEHLKTSISIATYIKNWRMETLSRIE